MSFTKSSLSKLRKELWLR